jgi:hypothetical protein
LTPGGGAAIFGEVDDLLTETSAAYGATYARSAMIRIQFSTDQDRIKGNYLLATNSVVRRLRGQVFEVAQRDLRLLDEHQIHYAVLPIPEPSGADQEVRNPLTVEL